MYYLIMFLCYYRKYADGVNKMRSILHDTLTLTLTQPDPHLHLDTLTGVVQIVSFLGAQVTMTMVYYLWLIHIQNVLLCTLSSYQ